jgi:hypothetical protein
MGDRLGIAGQWIAASRMPWSLYGPTPSAPIVKRGIVASPEEAKVALLANWRALQELERMQDAD